MLSPGPLDLEGLGPGMGRDKALKESTEQGCESRSWLINMGNQNMCLEELMENSSVALCKTDRRLNSEVKDTN